MITQSLTMYLNVCTTPSKVIKRTGRPGLRDAQSDQMSFLTTHQLIHSPLERHAAQSMTQLDKMEPLNHYQT